jgi:murein endopeptidase
VIDYVQLAIERVNARFPKLHRLAIGDLSGERGGPISGHASHQSGRDVDLGLYFQHAPADYPKAFVHVRKGKLHVGATWALVEALFSMRGQPGGPWRIFLDYDIQRALYQHARKQGVSKAQLSKIFQYPNGASTRDRFVQHVAHHADHLHVRFGCPPHDRTCID